MFEDDAALLTEVEFRTNDSCRQKTKTWIWEELIEVFCSRLTVRLLYLCEDFCDLNDKFSIDSTWQKLFVDIFDLSDTMENW